MREKCRVFFNVIIKFYESELWAYQIFKNIFGFRAIFDTIKIQVTDVEDYLFQKTYGLMAIKRNIEKKRIKKKFRIWLNFKLIFLTYARWKGLILNSNPFSFARSLFVDGLSNGKQLYLILRTIHSRLRFKRDFTPAGILKDNFAKIIGIFKLKTSRNKKPHNKDVVWWDSDDKWIKATVSFY